MVNSISFVTYLPLRTVNIVSYHQPTFSSCKHSYPPPADFKLLLPHLPIPISSDHSHLR